MKKWRKYIFEFLVVFLGVTLSFIVEEWRSDLSDKREKKALFQRTKKEIRDFLRIYEHRQKEINASDSLFKLISDKEPIRIDSPYHALLLIVNFSSSPWDLSIEDFPSINSLHNYIGNSRDSITALRRSVYGAIKQLEALKNFSSQSQLFSRSTPIFSRYRVQEDIEALSKPDFNKILPKIDLVKYNNLVHDAEFVSFVSEARIYRANYKGLERSLIVGILPWIVEELDKELLAM